MIRYEMSTFQREGDPQQIDERSADDEVERLKLERDELRDAVEGRPSVHLDGPSPAYLRARRK